MKKKIPQSTLVIQLRELALPKVTSSGNLLSLEFKGDEAKASRKIASSQLPESSFGEDSFDNGRKYQGAPLEKLELKNIEVGEAIRLVLRSTGYDVVIGEDVKGPIGSLSLTNTPWDQAFHLILQSKKLGFTRKGNVVRVTSIETLKSELLEIEKQEDTELLKTVLIPVSYARAAALEPRARPFLSKRGKIDIDDRTNTLIIRDVDSVISRLQKLFAVLDTQPPTISISAKFLEVKKSFSRTLGLGLMNMAGQTSGINFGSAEAPFAGPGLNAGAVGGTINLSAPRFAALNAQLTLAETQERAKTLSNPTIVVQQGQSGNITQGKTINVPQAVAQGGAVNTPLTVNANLNLTVTPVVANDGSISLDTNISESVAQPIVGNTVTTNNRSLRTQIILQNGDTAVLGGVLAGSESTSTGGVPFLKDLPLLGYLFGQNVEKTEQNEVLVFITARILNPEAAFKQKI